MVWCKVPAGKKKGQKSAASKKKSTKSKSSAQRKTNVKLGQPYAGNDLTAKLFATMEKHKDVSSTLCSKKSDAKIKITITMAHLIRINSVSYTHLTLPTILRV